MPLLSRREFTLAASFAPFISIAHAAPPKLSCSTFSIEVTPPIGHPCMGGGIAPVKEIVDPLYAHGFTLFGAGEPIAFVAVDWCEIRNDAYDQWRQTIANAIGTKRERVLVSALHQHDTPIADLTAQKFLDDSKAKGAICMPDFHAKTVARVAKAIKDSLANTRPVTHIGTGQAKVERVASNRRFTDDTGRLRFDRTSASRDPKARDADGGTIDPYLKSLTLYDGEQAIVNVHAYAVHPMSYYGRGGASADFVGLARKLRQAEEPKTLQIYVSGCSGNVTAGKFNDGALENRPELGKRILQAMRDASKASVKQPINECTYRCEKLELPVRSGAGFSEADLKKRLADGPRPFDQCLAALGLSWRKRVLAGQPIDVPAIDFGSAALLLLPAESYVEFQLMAQAARPKDFVLTAGYGESGPGYIPIEKAWEEKDGNLSDWCWVDPGSEAKMKKAIEAVLKSKR